MGVLARAVISFLRIVRLGSGAVRAWSGGRACLVVSGLFVLLVVVVPAQDVHDGLVPAGVDFLCPVTGGDADYVPDVYPVGPLSRLEAVTNKPLARARRAEVIKVVAGGVIAFIGYSRVSFRISGAVARPCRAGAAAGCLAGAGSAWPGAVRPLARLGRPSPALMGPAWPSGLG